MAKSTDKIKRQLSKLSDEDLKEVFEFFQDEEVEEVVKEEEPKEEVKETKEETPVKKEEPKEEPKKPVYDEMFSEFMSKIDEKFKHFATKEDLEEISKEIPKTEDWGIKSTPSPTKEEYEYDNPNDIINKLNSTEY